MTQNSNDDFAQRDFDDASFDINRRQVFNRRPRKMSDMISKITARYGVGSRQSHHQIQGVFDQIVGTNMANHCRVGGLNRGVLEIQVSHPVINQQLGMRRHEIIEKLKQKLPNEKIRDLRFRSGQI